MLHVRRGDVYYLGPKTGRPHPHYVESAAMLEVLSGVREAVGEQARLYGVVRVRVRVRGRGRAPVWGG